MKNAKYNSAEIKKYMADHKVSRSTAVRHLYPAKAAAAPAKLDVKQAAANDKVEFANPVDAPIVIDNPNAKKPKTVGQAVAKAVNKVEAGAARSEGLRLYKLAGRPTKAQFIRVYGKRGHLMTWDQRAEAGVPAAKFQAALAEKQGK